MTTHRALNVLLATLIAAVLSTSYLLDGPTDHSAEHAQAAALDDAIKTEAAQARFARAGAAICGENAAVMDLGDGTIQCLTKRGYKTRRVSL